MPQNQIEVIRKIESTLKSGKPMSLHGLSKKTKLHYTTVKRYINLIENVKSMPEIDVIRSDKTTLVRMSKQGLLSLPEEEQNKIIKSHFPELSADEKVLLKLLGKNAVSETSGVNLQKGKIIRPLLKAGIIKKTKDGKIYLSDMGYKMAKGAKDIYGR